MILLSTLISRIKTRNGGIMLKTVVIFASCLVLWTSAGYHGYRRETACQRELRKAKASHLLGRRIPVCDAQGNYAPKQCSGSKCYCVLKDGSNIGYSVNIWEAQDQTCNCARDLEEYKRRGQVGKHFDCSANGNYKPKQCNGSVCYCVDENGKQVGASVHITEFKSLVCENTETIN